MGRVRAQRIMWAVLPRATGRCSVSCRLGGVKSRSRTPHRPERSEPVVRLSSQGSTSAASDARHAVDRWQTSPTFASGTSLYPVSRIWHSTCTCMGDQIGRVEGYLRDQVDHFNRHVTALISVGSVWINCAGRYTSYERDRPLRTREALGSGADEAGRRLRDDCVASSTSSSSCNTERRTGPLRTRSRAWTAPRVIGDYSAARTRISRVCDAPLVRGMNRDSSSSR